MTVYSWIFMTNVVRILDERHMTKNELAERSGISNSFLSYLTTGKANPSLKVMEVIAQAIETPLPQLLEATGLSQQDFDALAGDKAVSSVPPGYECVTAILPAHRAFLVRHWAAEAQKKLQSS